MNKIYIMGRLGRRPQLRFTQSGKAICTFPVAVNSRRGGVEHTQWFDVQIWGKPAENCERYLDKGSRVFVEGSVELEMWEKRDGTQNAQLVIRAWQVTFLEALRQQPPGSVTGEVFNSDDDGLIHVKQEAAASD